MTCVRCGSDSKPGDAAGARDPLDSRRPTPWCKSCELHYDAWSRQHASDIVWEVLAAGLIVGFAGMGLPLLGVSWLAAATGIFAGFGTLIGLHRFNRRRRRRQYLSSGGVPRAYLPSKSSG